MKKNHKQKLLIDKKECSSCGHILEKDIKICDECGYDMTMEEAFKIYMKEFKKILNEQTTPKEYEYNPKKDPSNAQQITTIKTPLRNLKPGSTVKVTADEGRNKKIKQAKNPWAICTSSVGRKDMEKYEKCVQDVKHQKNKKKSNIDEDLQRLEEYIERIIMDSEVNPKIKKGNFKQFVSKLK